MEYQTCGETDHLVFHTAGENVLKRCTGDHLQIIVRRREGWGMIGWMLVSERWAGDVSYGVL